MTNEEVILMVLYKFTYATETGISSGLMGHLGSYADFTLPL